MKRRKKRRMNEISKKRFFPFNRFFFKCQMLKFSDLLQKVDQFTSSLSFKVVDSRGILNKIITD